MNMANPVLHRTPFFKILVSVLFLLGFQQIFHPTDPEKNTTTLHKTHTTIMSQRNFVPKSSPSNTTKYIQFQHPDQRHHLPSSITFEVVAMEVEYLRDSCRLSLDENG